MNVEFMRECALYLLLFWSVGFIMGVLITRIKQKYYDAVADRLSGKEGKVGWFLDMSDIVKETLIISMAIASVVIVITLSLLNYHIEVAKEKRKLSELMSSKGYVYSPPRGEGWVEDER